MPHKEKSASSEQDFSETGEFKVSEFKFELAGYLEGEKGFKAREKRFAFGGGKRRHRHQKASCVVAATPFQARDESN